MKEITSPSLSLSDCLDSPQRRCAHKVPGPIPNFWILFFDHHTLNQSLNNFEKSNNQKPVSVRFSIASVQFFINKKRVKEEQKNVDFLFEIRFVRSIFILLNVYKYKEGEKAKEIRTE